MAPTPEQLRRLALAARARAELLMRQAEVYARAADELEGLRVSEHPRTVVSTEMEPAHKTAISAARRGARDAEFGAALNAAGYSIRSLALALGVSPAAIHAHRLARPLRNSRPIPAARAAEIARLTGWPADEEHWPCGIASESDQ